MNITVKLLPKSAVQLTIEVSGEHMEKFRQKAIQQLGAMVNIPGFRKGHAPLDILKLNLREGTLEDRTRELALTATYSEAVSKENLQVVSRPKINIVKESHMGHSEAHAGREAEIKHDVVARSQPFIYEAIVAIYPKVEIGGYDRHKIKKNESKITDQDVEKALSEIQRKHATYRVVDRKAKMNDRVEIDFEGYDENGVHLEKTVSKNHPVIIGSGNLVKGFEEELVDLKKDQKKKFKIKFPKDYFHKPFQNKTVEFHVEVKRVEEVILPQWTEEFIEQVVGTKKSFDEMKETLRKNLLLEAEHEEKQRRENEFLQYVMEKTRVELPEVLIEEEIDALVEEFKSELEQMRVTLEAYLEQNKKELKDLREPRRKEAEKRLKLRFGLQKIFEQENVVVTSQELHQEIEKLVGFYPKSEQAKVRNEYQEESWLYRRLENRLKMDKLFERFLEQ